MKDSIYHQIEQYIDHHKEKPFFLIKDFQRTHPMIKSVHLRQVLRRLVINNKLIRPFQRKGVYIIHSDQPTHGLNLEDVLMKKYVLDQDGQRVGFLGGINFLNSIGLTTQTSPIIYVYSKQLSHPKRMVRYGNYRVMLIRLPEHFSLTNLALAKVIAHLPLIEQMSEFTYPQTQELIRKYLNHQEKKVNLSSFQIMMKSLPPLMKLKAYEYELNRLIDHS
jgi:hypothetical protein